MVKKLEGVKWETVPLDGFPISANDNFQGFVGLEECLVYDGLESPKKKTNKKKPQKRINTASSIDKDVQSKKIKLSNGFVVESCEFSTPSITNSVLNEDIKDKKHNKNSKISVLLQNIDTNVQEKPKKNGVDKKKTKLKLGENVTQVESCLTPEDMLTWAEFKLPEPILKALAELGFKQPTKIQQLSLPAAIHGRRDILGAAETGSGKTLAFGLPILTGIMKLKEKAALGLDVYELPFKKTSVKRQNKNITEDDKKTKKKGHKKGSIKQIKSKESSEDGYDSEDEDSDKESDANEKSSLNKNLGVKSGNNFKAKPPDKKVNSEDDFIKEIEVSLKKKDVSTDEGNDSDDSENYVHLSEMLDSDDLADTSDDESKKNKSTQNVEKESDKEISEEDEIIGQEQGIGCVKVIDNVEMPGHVVTKTGKPLYALILTPTRELAIQISQHLKALAKYTGIRIGTIVGGMATVKQERVLRSGPEVVVATPGRLWELINCGQTHLQQLHSVKFLAIDETDRMIERNHFEELYPLLERLNADEARKSTRQNFVFSATLTMVHDLPSHMKGKKVTKRGKILNRKIEKNTAEQKVKRLISMIGMTDPKVVDITTQNLGTAETLTECRIPCALEHKDAYLYYILKRHPGRTIVFCNSIGCVKRLAQLFNLLKCRPLPLHASMIQKQRLKNLEKFRDDPRGVLISTDVAARGLDIPDVDHVIHYQVPRTAENYVHRSGRTARANKEGLTILMMEPSEAHLYAKMCRTLNKTSELPTFPVPPSSLAPLKELLAVARDIEVLMLKQKRGAQAVGWREKAAREMDIIIDEDDVPMTEVDPAISKALKVKKKYLDFMISRPLFPKGFSFKYPTLNDPITLTTGNDNALQVMKKAMASGELKRQKRKSKNAPLLKLEKMLKK